MRARPVLLLVAAVLAAPGAAGAAVVRSGPLQARVSERPWGLELRAGGVRLAEHPNAGTGRTGRLGFVSGGRWSRATRVIRAHRGPRGWAALLATTGRGRIRVSVTRSQSGAINLGASVAGLPRDAVQLFGIGFRARPGERYLGFGERSNAVNQRGRTVENYVGEGPYLDGDYAAVAPSIPPWGIRRRADATYFPMPWLLSTRGYGVLSGNHAVSRFRLGGDRRGAWSFEVASPTLSLSFLAGPRPADVVRRLVRRTGVQPAPAAAWMLGPWFQTGHANEEPDELGHLRLLRDGDAPVSAVETHMRYMPCGLDRGHEASERARTAAFHAAGLAALTYMREAVCQSYEPPWSQGVAANVFVRRPDGGPYTFDAFVGSGVTPVGMIDFARPEGSRLHDSLLARAVANGFDGWMEDYGEYVPPDAEADHNRYPVLYHRSGMRFARRQPRPIVRFVRSGWTGVHPYAQIVWGGDPSTVWGFDGLRSSVTEALTMGLSGIGIWGSDIGGFFTITGPGLSRELLHRWIQFGAVSTVMRTKAQGIAAPKASRPQIWEPQTLPLWRRYAKLHTQLYPYVAGAVAEYRRTGMPVMRHLSLAYPRDRRAVSTDAEFLFGPDLLAAPVLEPGARRRRVYLPRGTWVDLWRSASYDAPTGGLRLRRARPLRGGRTVRLPAPLAELPLLARAGAILPMLPPDVDTLADYGEGGGAVRLADRRDRLDLLAFPHGRSAGRLGPRGRWHSVLTPAAWTLRLRPPGPRRFRLQAALPGGAPRSVRLGSRALPRSAWSYRGGVLRTSFRARSAKLVVTR
ncbi:MAG: glycoside hydrolase family 31 protein [Thermoleophilaceae bacterium]|nr:glycoside hydrolase family 31 protein [Thermoleophilaceae bacterium]